ncbi:methionine synthase [Tistrella mobilis]|uniref:Methionine synthase n=1 Tax=Tistrella mobilis (strain KA081020-065) TaxID=1110502 RepID=I3TIS7_TISMK|nr:methionine synthase [Tistrella mobilis]AFK52665.1 5-methyltetrahydrofolate--homocysteine methyltransferase [Tistrella mobilis KA081020-065]
MSRLLDFLGSNVLLLDGGMGSQLQARDLSVDGDYWGKENCSEILNLSRPDIIRDIHTAYFEAGADAVETNTFGGSPITLGEFDLTDQAFEINVKACELAHEAAERFRGDGRERFVIGSIGPGTRLPSLGHIDYDRMEAALTIQARGLIAGRADAFLIETCQDPLQIKAAVNAVKIARAEAGVDLPIMVQVTVETVGTLLVGTDIAAATAIVDALDVDVMGLNCATGPQEMQEHVRYLSQTWRRRISVLPNAGLPELVDGRTHYPLGARELAQWLERFIVEDGIDIVGGCCGTGPDHIRAIDEMLRRRGGARHRPAPVKREVNWMPGAASLFGFVPYFQENAYFSIGERCNANGSKKFREMQDAGNWDGCVGMAREQVKEGSNAIDLCAAFTGRNEIADMTALTTAMRGSVSAPLVIDSTELNVIETTLKLYGGKPIINSINFEDGEEPARARLALAKKFGAAMVALTIDEEGMAKTADRKLAIAERLYALAVDEYGLAPEDLLFDPLTFTIATGNEDDRKLGIETLEGIRLIRERFPRCQIILGLSNISFGLKAAARHVLNSVFLDYALKAGMSGAIVHLSKLMPLHKIAEDEVKVAEDLIFDRRAEGYDPLISFMALFADRKAESQATKVRPETVEERLKLRIIDGDREGLGADLDEAMAKMPPLEIINTVLLDGMKVVGELFGAGKMQLPFVLQSAETMKAAVAWLEPHMEKVEGEQKATIVLATVKGDVHDIGKNLVDIILTNNGYRVVNLGIKQPVASIIQAAREHRADVVGMSGLLVKSTVIMRENLEEMTREGLDVPVLLGGAALTRKYVEEDCVAAYGAGRVAYARDAFDGLSLMNAVVDGRFDAVLDEAKRKREARPSSIRGPKKRASSDEDIKAMLDRPVDFDEVRVRRSELHGGIEVPEPPFWGARVIEHVPLKSVVPYLNETMLFQFHWGYKRAGRKPAEFDAYVKQELWPKLEALLKTCAREKILDPQAAYGYWKAAGEGNDLVLFETDGTTELARFRLPRQDREGGLCVADFVRDISDPVRDVIGLQVVTVGQNASDVARDWFAADRYQDYLYLHGLGVEIAEAMAEYVHKRIRAELGYAAEDAREIDRMLKQGYRGSRYSFGYPACPNLADQRVLLELLGADRIGIQMGDEDQLHPEQSTSAIVLLHPQAKYFSV